MDSPPALEIQDLRRSFSGRPALLGLSLTVRVGEVFGLLGPNGAGKTTTVLLATGQLRPDGGTLRVLGRDPASDPRGVRRALGVMLEEPGHYERLPVRSNLAFFARLYGAPMARVDQLLDQVGLARALVGQPRVLFLDEPTSGLDPHAARGVRSLVRRFSEEGGTVFLTTHLLEEAEELCHRVGILDQGRLVALGNPQDLCREHLPAEIEVLRGGRTLRRPPGLEELFVHLTGRSLD